MIFKILREVLDGMQGFEVPRPPEKNRKKLNLKVHRFPIQFRNYFLLIFIDVLLMRKRFCMRRAKTCYIEQAPQAQSWMPLRLPRCQGF